MRIKHLKVENFKSLVEFDLPLAKFNCLVGLNGSGKSTVLQFFDFLSQQFRGNLDDWLRKRQWKASDINSKLIRKNNIDFEVSLRHEDDKDVEIKWSASFNRQALRCTSERITWNNNLILRVEDGKYTIWALNKQERKLPVTIPFEYQGSLLSQIKESQLTSEIIELKRFFEGLHSLDLLAPELLRQRTRDNDNSSNNSLSLGGNIYQHFCTK